MLRSTVQWRGFCGWAVVGAIALTAFPVLGVAQSTPSLAPTREEIERAPPSGRAPQSRVVVEGELDRGPCALANPEFAAVRLTLREVAFDGLRGISPDAMRGAYASLIGQEQPVSVVCDVRDRAAAILRDAGYIASVQVPEQSIADGRLRFNVVMAHLAQVRVRGDAGRSEKIIARYLKRLEQQPVFNRYDAERYLLLASDLPGYNVRLALRPAGTTPGEVIGDVSVIRTPFAIDANVSNLSSRELGRWGGQARAQLFGLTGLGDVTTLGFFSTSDFHEQQTLQLGHDFRVGAQGLAVSGAFNYSWARPDIKGVTDRIDARTLFATGSLSYPFVRRQSHSVRGALGFDFINQNVAVAGDPFTRDRLRVAFARLGVDAISLDFTRPGFSVAEPVWRAVASVELRHGLDIFDASRRCGSACLASTRVPTSRIGADPTAGIARANFYGEFRPAPRVTFALDVRGQYSSKSLLSFEQFSAGNFNIGRGYDPGTLLGDRGIAASSELRLGSVLPKSVRDLATEPYIFLDYARVSNEEGSFLPRGQRQLTSVGSGLRATVRGFGVDAAVAVPLERTGFVNRHPGPRILLSVTRRLWPWAG